MIRQLSKKQFHTLMADQAVEQILMQKKKPSVPLLNLSRLNSDMLQKQDINKSLSLLYEKPQRQMNFSERNRKVISKRYEE